MKTNAARILDSRGLAYELLEYEVSEDLAGETVALEIGLDPSVVYKTLVVRGDKRGVAFAVIPVNAVLDLKAMARATGDRRVELVPLSEVLPLTGYIRGGVTVLGAKKAYPVILHTAALELEKLSVSAGVRGTQLFLSPADYVTATGAKVADIARDKP